MGLCVLGFAAVAVARPGGGGGFSSGGHSSGGGGHSSGGGSIGLIIDLIRLIIWLIEMCIEYPWFGVTFGSSLVGLVVYTYWKKYQRRNYAEWSTLPPRIEDTTARRARVELLGVRKRDPDFSLVLFEDFLYSLFAEVHTARGAGKLDRLSVYLSPNAMAQLRDFQAGPVEDVIVGAMTLLLVNRTKEHTEVLVQIESNSTQGGVAYWDVEEWLVKRRAGCVSRPWSRATQVACPSCGAPLESVAEGRCASCKEEVGDGRFDWQVTRISRGTHEAREPILTGDTVEAGTSDQTLMDPDLNHAFVAVADALGMSTAAADKAVTARLETIYHTFQKSWAARDLATMRPYMSDTLLRMQERWIAAYRRQNLTNVTENPRLVRTERVRAVLDRYFAAVTFRVYAEGLDYTVNEKGSVVAGSKRFPRRYTEYWTLVRTLKARKPENDGGSDDTRPTCPGCGAELDIEMAGPCPYCKAQVTSACFDWVLSRIEQDETYRG